MAIFVNAHLYINDCYRTVISISSSDTDDFSNILAVAAKQTNTLEISNTIDEIICILGEKRYKNINSQNFGIVLQQAIQSGENDLKLFITYKDNKHKPPSFKL